ncbi:DUF808 domain-containing protein [Vannielia litorea]|uniref:DUF808 domain-containing protein n=1 Tax=Vannielia litorea TaxID=1217970 RepID=UPI001BD069C2|nr:DUF808 domain-containing protein [Vannielia litorea]MBS8228846.1 DUF808 domain-containing protein [Vannielia litorea]
MSGLLALLDDVAAIAKLAAASVDDIASQAAKASAKAAGAVIDDAAVTPKYVQGFEPKRELPIVWRIARGSVFNKLVILLPAALLLSAFAPWMIYPLLMLGGAYLCFEGAEKIWHLIHPSSHHVDIHIEGDKAHLEEQKIQGAIKTDFILSAEIMTIILSNLDAGASIWFQGAALALAGVMITAAVYGSVAIIVKADDVGLHMADRGRLGLTRALGRGIVIGMPWFLKFLMIVGTAAMLWVGGQIIIHSLAVMGWHDPEHWVRDAAVAAAAKVPENWQAVVEWIAGAGLAGVLGLLLGFMLIPLVQFVIAPVWKAVRG